MKPLKRTPLLPALLFTIAAIALAWPCVVRAGNDYDTDTNVRLEKFDNGPATIDVSNYPQGIKINYELFSQRCSQCHQLSRPINYDHALPDEWSRYVKRMMRKPGSGISIPEARNIYEFLVYDVSVRKKAQLNEKLAAATPEDKTTAEAKIKGIRDKYGGK